MMTVKDLINELKKYPSNYEVVRVIDFENTDEHGHCKVESLEGTMTQTYVDLQFGDNEETVVMIY